MSKKWANNPERIGSDLVKFAIILLFLIFVGTLFVFYPVLAILFAAFLVYLAIKNGFFQ